MFLLSADGLHLCLKAKTKQKVQGCFWSFPYIFIKPKFGRVISSPTRSFPLSLRFHFNSGQRPKEAVHLCYAAASKLGLGRLAGKQVVTALKNYWCLRRNDEFSNFSRHRLAFPREAGAALNFLSTFCFKTKSRIRLISQKYFAYGRWLDSMLKHL